MEQMIAFLPDLAAQVAQMLVVLSVAPLFTGFTRKARARLLGRRGPPVLQPYRDLYRLIQKEVVLAHNASWLFRVAPYVVFSSTVAVTLMVPLVAAPQALGGVGDVLVVVYLLLLATFFLALAGLDPGSAFGGMGASRDVTVRFLKMLANHVAEREQQLIELAYNSVRRRVASALVALHEQDKRSISLLREDLAAMAGTAKETLIRTLADFKNEGLVDIKDGVISILNVEKLRKMPN